MFSRLTATIVSFAFALTAFGDDAKSLDKTKLKTIDTGNKRVGAISFDASQRLMVTTHGSPGLGEVTLWKLPAFEKIRETDLESHIVNAVIAPCGKCIAISVAGRGDVPERSLIIWHVEKWEKIRETEESVTHLAYSPDSLLLASTDSKYRVAVRDARSGTIRWQTSNLERAAHGISFSNDGRYLFACFANNPALTCWDALTGAKIWDSGPSDFGKRKVWAGGYGVSVADDDSLLMTGATGVFETLTGRFCRGFLIEGYEAADLAQSAFADRGRWVLATRMSGAKRFGVFQWDARHGKMLVQDPDIFRNVIAFKVICGHRLLVATTADGELLVYPLPEKAAPAANVTVSDDELNRLWERVGSADTKESLDAMRELADSPKQSVRFVREQVQLASDSTIKAIRDAVRALDDDNFRIRRAAVTRLTELGDLARPALRSAYLQPEGSDEKRKRIGDVFRGLEQIAPKGESLRSLRGVQLLGMIGNAEALEALETLAAGPIEDRVADEARPAARRLKAELSLISTDKRKN